MTYHDSKSWKDVAEVKAVLRVTIFKSCVLAVLEASFISVLVIFFCSFI